MRIRPAENRRVNIVNLNDNQIAEFEEQGYLLFPGLLDNDEVAILQSAMPEMIREKEDSTMARLAFGAHAYSGPFRCLSLLPRLLNPVRELLGEDVYLHQSRINPKPGYGRGLSWDWHQDYPPWHTIDKMPEPRCIMASVFIDDCTAITSPLLVLPGSHRLGLLDSKLHKDARGRGYALHHIDDSTLERHAKECGIDALIGPAGSVAFVHCNVLHGSSNNVSPWRRAIIYLIYNARSNACTGTERPWYQNNRDFTPLQPHNESCLRALARPGK